MFPDGNESGDVMKRVILALAFMLFPTMCYADLNDVMISLKHLNGAATYGSSYKDYALFLRVAKSEVGDYLIEKEAKQNKKLRDAISEVLSLYELADPLFSRAGAGLINAGTDASPTDKKIASDYFARFPEDKKDVAEGGVLKNQQGVKLETRKALNKVFKRASEKYEELVKMLK
jgi:hypothetical protein